MVTVSIEALFASGLRRSGPHNVDALGMSRTLAGLFGSVRCQHSSPGMIFTVQLFEPLARDVGVYLGCGYVAMSEHGLNGSQVGSAFQEVAGE